MTIRRWFLRQLAGDLHYFTIVLIPFLSIRFVSKKHINTFIINKHYLLIVLRYISKSCLFDSRASLIRDMSENLDENKERNPEVSELFETNMELREAKGKELPAEVLKEQTPAQNLDKPNPKPSRSDSLNKQAVPDSEEDPLVGQIFAEKYQVLSALGKGGMSTVYKVRHIDLDMDLALKVLHQHLWKDPLSVERFRMEAKTIGKLSNPYLITFRDFGVTGDGQPYLVMDYLQGVSLGRKIVEENGISIDSSLDILEKLCYGLEEAHKNGVTHRDIKPANVMFLSDGHDTSVKLVDFGIAKLAAEESDQRMTLTQTGEVFGSPYYMSPEQCLGVTVDHRSDIYSLGCLLYEALTGVPPFVGDSILDTMNAHVNREPEPLGVAKESLVDEAKKLGYSLDDVNYVVMKCLQKMPADRYQSLSELLSDLEIIKEKNKLTGKQRLWKKDSPRTRFLLRSVAVMILILVSHLALYVSIPQYKYNSNRVGRHLDFMGQINFAKFAMDSKNFSGAETHLREALALANQEESEGEKHVKRLAALEGLTKALRYQAKYPEMDRVIEEHKKELRQSLNDLSNVKDEDSMSILDSVNEESKEDALAGAIMFDKLGKQSATSGKTDVAAKYFQKAYDLRKKWLAEGDEKLIESMDSLALISVIQGKPRKAGPLWQEAFKQAEKHLTDESKVKVSLYKNMGRIYQSEKRIKNVEESERCFKKALELARKHYGENSKEAIEVMRDYYALLNKLGREDEAQKLWQQIDALKKTRQM